MGGFFGTISRQACKADLFYGTDYNSHLGTRRAGMATYDPQRGFIRKIHSLESTYFRTKFECELPFFEGNSGIGVISDTDPQPIIFNSHLGKFAIVTVAKIANIDELEKRMLAANHHFAELSSGKINQTELVALLITEGRDFVEGIENVYNSVKGSCSMLLLTENGIIAARDKLGRTPIVIGKKGGAYAASSESTCFPNLDYQIDRYIGPGEIVRITADGVEQLRKPNEEMQICSFLWVYYGFPTSCYEGVNVEKVRFDSGVEMGRSDNSDVDCACGIPDSDILIVTATGTHRAHMGDEQARLLGEDICRRIRVIDHDCRDTAHLVHVGDTSRGTPVWFNSYAIACDKIIITCGVVYHFLAGFGGGGQMLLARHRRLRDHPAPSQAGPEPRLRQRHQRRRAQRQHGGHQHFPCRHLRGRGHGPALLRSQCGGQ